MNDLTYLGRFSDPNRMIKKICKPEKYARQLSILGKTTSHHPKHHKMLQESTCSIPPDFFNKVRQKRKKSIKNLNIRANLEPTISTLGSNLISTASLMNKGKKKGDFGLRIKLSQVPKIVEERAGRVRVPKEDTTEDDFGFKQRPTLDENDLSRKRDKDEPTNPSLDETTFVGLAGAICSRQNSQPIKITHHFGNFESPPEKKKKKSKRKGVAFGGKESQRTTQKIQRGNGGKLDMNEKEQFLELLKTPMKGERKLSVITIRSKHQESEKGEGRDDGKVDQFRLRFNSEASQLNGDDELSKMDLKEFLKVEKAVVEDFIEQTRRWVAFMNSRKQQEEAMKGLRTRMINYSCLTVDTVERIVRETLDHDSLLKIIDEG